MFNIFGKDEAKKPLYTFRVFFEERSTLDFIGTDIWQEGDFISIVIERDDKKTIADTIVTFKKSHISYIARI